MTSTAAPGQGTAALIAQTGIAPSILAADHARLGEQVRAVLRAGARVIHCDVMDGHFVPPISFGAGILAAIADLVHGAGGMLDVHLMVQQPERQIEEIAGAGADLITIHAEATSHVHHALGAIRRTGCLAGLALNPGTPVSAVEQLGADLDLVLCMSVDPGWGGQRFIAATAEKIAVLRARLPDECALEVDGGIDVATAGECVRRGANLLVAGSAVFGAADPAAAYTELAASVRLS